MTTIDWRAIRSHNGSQQGGFQQLCVGLAMDEKMEGTSFFTPGDPDGGVDCYEVFEDDSERGWQAKYFDSLGDSQFSELDESVRRALDTHGRLVQYIICIPMNLADPRKEGRIYAQDKWNQRVSKWKQWAKQREMNVEFALWGDSQLVSKLTQEKHARKRFYWFNDKVFDRQWFETRLKESIDTADDRYTPELHIQLNIAEQLEYFARTRAGFERVESLVPGIRRRLSSLRHPLSVDGQKIECAGLAELMEAVQRVLVEFTALEPNPDGHVPIERILDRISAVNPLLESVRRAAEHSADEYDGRRGENHQRSRYSYNPYARIARDADALQDELAHTSIQLTTAERFINSRVLVLKGEAGAGKTHLMCDLTRNRVEAGAPALLLMGQQFTDASAPWNQLLPLIGMPEEAIEDFIGGLEEAGRVAGSRVLLLIDALNEGRGREIWPNHLSAFMARLAESEWIGVVLSVRTTYEEFIIPRKVRDEAVALVHPGFGGHEYEAARKFFQYYGIEFQSTPILTPEFKNPLYLKTICRGLQLRGESRLPRGSSGITAAFQLFAEAVNERLANQLVYNRRHNYVRAALEAIAAHFWETGNHWLKSQTAEELVNACLSDVPREYSRSLFRGLLDEGILSEHIVRGTDGDTQYVVRPSYERFGDLVVADLVIRDYQRRRASLGLLGRLRWLLGRQVGAVRRLLGLSHSRSSTAISGVPFLDSKDRMLSLGVVEALCIQVPEQTGQELTRLAPEFLNEPGIGWTFEGSIVWRRIDAFTEETGKVWSELIDTGGFEINSTETLLTVSAIPNHPFNAEFLNDRLSEYTMADRDARWTTQIHHTWESDGPIDRLVDWARRVTPTTEVDDQVVDLSAMTLAWILASSNRFLRDTATKALVSLLDGRLESVDRLVNRLTHADDLYVVERVYAVAYGVAMRSRDTNGVERVAQSVYHHIFAQGFPPPHILLRDYARGIIERATYLSADLHIDIDKVRPPYQSSWPTILGEESAQELIEAMDQEEGNDSSMSVGWRAIRASVLGGDFARYVIGTNSSDSCRDWLSIGIDQERWRPEQERRRELASDFSLEERAALDAYEAIVPSVTLVPPMEGEAVEPSDDPLSFVSRFIDARDQAYSHFLASLSDEHRTAWVALDEKRPGFSLRKIQRYVLNRVIELGWTTDRFGRFDSLLHMETNDTRTGRKAERIGKKYQWIAYHEILAYLADHFQFCQQWGDDRYDGPWQIGCRDIDPSAPLDFPLGREGEPAGSMSAWWAPIAYDSWSPDVPTADWIVDNNDVPPLNAGLVVPDFMESDVSWVCCYGFQLFQEPYPPGQYDYSVERRELWFRKTAILVPRGSSDQFIEWVMSGGYRESHWEMSVPQTHGSDVFLGEHCWSVASAQRVGAQEAEPLEWCYPPDSDPCSAQIPIVTYTPSSSGYDCSVQLEARELCLPADSIIEACGLQWTGVYADYVDGDARLAAFDPSAHELGPPALLVRSDILDRFLSEHDLEICWVITGEKQTIGSTGQPHGWLDLHGTYTYRDSGLIGRNSSKYNPPTPHTVGLAE